MAEIYQKWPFAQGRLREFSLLTIGRGYSSLDTRHQLVTRFKKSGKQRLVILFVSYHDPEGEDLAASFARSLRDDFGLRKVTPIKVALTGKQVAELNLPPLLKAKAKSSCRKKFVEANGENVFELEALPPETLQDYLRESVESVLDMDLFNAEREKERNDAVALERRRILAMAALQAA